MRTEVSLTRQRSELVDRFGGRCQTCGYSRCRRALQFHHTDSSEKGQWPGAPGRASIQEIEAHPERFVLLCANCHFEAHDAIDQANRMYATCLTCGEPVRTSPSLEREGRGRYCSKKCQHTSMRRLTDDQALDLIRRYAAGNTTQQRLADECGVTLMAVNNLLKGKSYRHLNQAHKDGLV